MTGELEQLSGLRSLDLSLDDIARRETAARARLQAAAAQLEAAREAQKNEKRLLDDALKEHKTLDLDLKKSEEQAKKYSTQMYEVKTNKEYTALKDEIEKAKGESQKVEDKILQLMMKEDELKGAATRRTAEAAEADRTHKTVEAEVKAELEVLAKDREAAASAREQKAKELPKGLLYRYDRIRALRGGSVLAMVVEAPGGGEVVCGECHMTVRPQMIVELHHAAELISCESCGRILYLESLSTSST